MTGERHSETALGICFKSGIEMRIAHLYLIHGTQNHLFLNAGNIKDTSASGNILKHKIPSAG